MVSLSNNHTLDRGETAIKNSVEYWNSQEGVVTAGSHLSFEDRETDNVFNKNNINYAFFSYTTTTNGIPVQTGKEYYVDVYDYELAKSDIEKVEKDVDVIFVAMHWGNEYQFTPSSEQEKIANELASLGVTVVIGTHPHVVQPIEYVDETLVIYSLGNFISGQNKIEQQIGMLASITIEKEVIDGITTKVTLNDINAELVYTSRQNYKNYTVYPFSNLTSEILSGYEALQEKYEGYINIKNDDRIKIGN